MAATFTKKSREIDWGDALYLQPLAETYVHSLNVSMVHGALCVAIEFQESRLVRHLLKEHDVDLNGTKLRDEFYALHFAVFRANNIPRDPSSTEDSQLEIIRLLLAHGADPNSMSCVWEYLPSLQLCKYLADDQGRCATVVEMLLDAGAEVDGQSRDGKTALIEFARLKKASIVKLLIERGANVHHTVDPRNVSGALSTVFNRTSQHPYFRMDDPDFVATFDELILAGAKVDSI